MAKKKFLITFGTSFVAYFILDFMFNNMMLYIMGGIILGTLHEISDGNVGIPLSILVWALILSGFITLFYRLRNKLLKYATTIIVGVLLYIVDIVVAGIPYSDGVDIEKIILLNNIIIGALVLSKSLLLSLIVYFERGGKQPDNQVMHEQPV